jgi:hypothetical protein
MSRFIVVLNGPPEVGKDTFIDLCQDILVDYGIGSVYSYSAVDEIKQWAQMMGWDGVKDEKGRKFLSDLKQLSINFNDGPTKYLSRMIEGSLAKSCVIFLHVREPQEIAKIKAIHPEIITCHMTRSSAPSYQNISDANTLNYHYDEYLQNDGALADLNVVAWQFLAKLYPKVAEIHTLRSSAG